jgi:hypothetical protein
MAISGPGGVPGGGAPRAPVQPGQAPGDPANNPTGKNPVHGQEGHVHVEGDEKGIDGKPKKPEKPQDSQGGGEGGGEGGGKSKGGGGCSGGGKSGGAGGAEQGQGSDFPDEDGDGIDDRTQKKEDVAKRVAAKRAEAGNNAGAPGSANAGGAGAGAAPTLGGGDSGTIGGGGAAAPSPAGAPA